MTWLMELVDGSGESDDGMVGCNRQHMMVALQLTAHHVVLQAVRKSSNILGKEKNKIVADFAPDKKVQ